MLNGMNSNLYIVGSDDIKRYELPPIKYTVGKDNIEWYQPIYYTVYSVVWDDI